MAKQARVPATEALVYDPTELVAQVNGYVIRDGKRVDKFTLQSPVFFDAADLQAWLDNVPENAQRAAAEKAVSPDRLEGQA